MTQEPVVVCCPGDRLAPADQYVPGAGTYVRNGFLYASVVGTQVIRQDSSSEASTSGRSVLEVVAAGSSPVVPKPGDVVTVKMTRVQQNSSSCNIMCIGTQALTQEFKGIIRQQDVRATEIDKIVMYDCFRPGDIVRAEVLSLGDARSYYLTTAKNEYGVVYAKSMAGVAMTPVSWEQMQCPETQAVERRKVAKVA